MKNPDIWELEGKLEIGPKENFFVFVEGEFLGRMLREHYRLPDTDDSYCGLERVRITVERLDGQSQTKKADEGISDPAIRTPGE